MRLGQRLERDDRQSVETVALDVALVGREGDYLVLAVLRKVDPGDAGEVAQAEDDDVTHRRTIVVNSYSP